MVRVAVVGASGYSGAELVGLLAGHPSVEIASLHAESSAGQAWEDLYPGKRHLHSGPILPFEPEKLDGLDVAFLALPHDASVKAAQALQGRVQHVIDISGGLRLPTKEAYRQWYGHEHPAPELLGRAAYGLPELFGCALKGAELVACAGCYATASQLAAAPALAAGRKGSRASVAISAMSGTSGAGRKGDLALSFSEVGGNLRAYRVGKHQHAPEIAQGLTRAAEREVSVTFVPNLVPIVRGILTNVILENEQEWTQEQALAAYRGFYEGRPFVRVVDARKRLPEVTDVVGTNFCDVAPVVDESAGTLVVVSVIDNIGKGAAGQALQVMNVVLGVDETTGLLPRKGA